MHHFNEKLASRESIAANRTVRKGRYEAIVEGRFRALRVVTVRADADTDTSQSVIPNEYSNT